ncbi:MAG: type II CAAX prenyl endopeptidase Rce1 family protein [Rhodomicrobium sp.]
MEMSSISGFPIGEVPFLSRLPQDRHDALERHVSICCFAAGERVFEEGEPNPGRLYIVLEGEAVLCNRGQVYSTHTMSDYETGRRGKDEILAAISFLDGQPFSSSAIAKTPLTLAMLDFSSGELAPASRKLRASVVSELRSQLTGELRGSVSARLGSLQQEAEFSRYKNAVGRIVVTTLSLLSFYTLLLSVLPQFMVALTVNFAISPFIIAMFAAVMGPVILYSGFPRSFFGLQTANWKSALGFSVLVSFGFIAAGAVLKLILIHTTQTFSSLSLFGVADVKENMHDVMMSPLYWVAVGLYLVLTPLQEFVARCCLQAPLYAFLNGTTFWRHVWSILVSNLVFAAAHSHISFAFAMAAFVPGLFWGWIFARTNSLIAAAASHFMIGGAGIFLFGIEEVVAKLMG